MRGGMKGTKNYEDGRRYDGEMKDGEANGTGKMTWHDGEVYAGEWKDGKANGKGKIKNVVSLFKQTRDCTTAAQFPIIGMRGCDEVGMKFGIRMAIFHSP